MSSVEPLSPTAQGKAPTPKSSPTGLSATPQSDAISHLDPTGAQITLWHAFTGVEEKTLLALILEFNTQNEWGITVKPEYGGHYYDLHRKTLAAIAFGSPPEMAFTYHSRVAEYAQADVIQPLDDYIASEKYGLTEEELQDYFPAFLAGDQYPAFDDERLSFSASLGMGVMYYNVDMLNELGYENPPATWDEFETMCMDATRDMDGDGINDTFGYAVSPDGSAFASWVRSRGGRLLSKGGQSVMFQEQGLEALTFLKDLIDSGYAYQAIEENGDRMDFGQGKVLFIFDSLDGLLYYHAAAVEEGTVREPEFEWSIAPFPHEVAKPIVGMYGPTLCVFKTTPQKQLAGWLFIKWFTEPEQAARWAVTANYFPVRKSAIETETIKAHFAENPLYEKAFSFLEYARMEPAIVGWQEIRDALHKAIVSVASGQASSEEAMYEVVEQVEGILTE